MTGSEAWSLVAPILAKYAYITSDGKPDAMSEAYVIVFGALKEMDEGRKVEKDGVNKAVEATKENEQSANPEQKKGDIVELTFQNWEREDAEEIRLGDRISCLLAKRGMTQRDLAKAIHVTEVSVSRYINNARCPKATEIIAIAKALDVSTDVLLGVSTAPERKKEEWLPEFNGRFTGGAYWFKCSKCGRIVPDVRNGGWNFCPNCGSDNRGEQDG